MFKSLRLQNFCSLLPSQSLPLGPKKAKSCLQRNHSGFLHLTGKTPGNIELCNFRLGPENSLVSSFLSTLVCRKYQNGYTFKKTLVQSPPSASTCLNPERGYFLLFFFFFLTYTILETPSRGLHYGNIRSVQFEHPSPAQHSLCIRSVCFPKALRPGRIYGRDSCSNAFKHRDPTCIL